jgi:hypothetical protein
MEHHKQHSIGRRLLQFFLAACLLAQQQPANAGSDDTGTTDVVGGSGVVSTGSPGKPGTQSKPPSAKRKAILAKTNPCPASAVNSPEGRYIDAGEQGIGMYQPYQCNPQTGWTLRFVCYERCPEGTPPPFVPPAPPSLDELYISLYRSIPAPDPLFAPPVDTGNNIAAVVGKRLYVNLTPATFEDKEGDYEWGNGYWYATFLLEPNNYQFTDGDTTTGLCTANDASARTRQGRNTLDQQNCSLIINTKPASGILPVTITSHWTATIVTNVPFFPQTLQLQSQTTYPVPIKQVQSIIVG